MLANNLTYNQYSIFGEDSYREYPANTPLCKTVVHSKGVETLRAGKPGDTVHTLIIAMATSTCRMAELSSHK